MKKAKSESGAETRERIMLAAMETIRTRGFAATRVDDICAAAGITKGAFFHHFASKEEMAQAAAKYFSDHADALFGAAPYQSIADPRDRFIGYLEFRRLIMDGPTPNYTCLLGTMVQEVHDTHPNIRDACHRYIWHHAASLVPMIEEAKAKYAANADFDALELALHTQAVLQGAFILGKASQDPELARRHVDHLIRYVKSLFVIPTETS